MSAAVRSHRSVAALAPLLPLLLGLIAVLLGAAAGTELRADLAVAVVATGLVLLLPLGWGIALTMVAAHLLPWLTAAAVGPLAIVDVMMLALIARAAPRLWSKREDLATRALPLALGGAFVLLGLGASLIAEGSSAETAFLRIAAYFVFAFTAVLALDQEERMLVLLAFVGATLGDTASALAGVSPTIPTGFPIGRYLGTLGDPAQFGVSIALAIAVLLGAPELVRSKALRGALILVLLVGLAGSATRSAGGAFVVAMTVLAAQALADRGVSPTVRAVLGAATGSVLVLGILAVTVGANAIGLEGRSAGIRVESLATGWNYFVTFPFTPSGMGNVPGEFPTYNTWLAAAVAIGFPAVLALAGVVIAAMVRLLQAGRAKVPLALGLQAALVAMALVTLTENLIFAGSSLTITWFVLLGMAIATPLAGVSAPDKAGA